MSRFEEIGNWKNINKTITENSSPEDYFKMSRVNNSLLNMLKDPR